MNNGFAKAIALLATFASSLALSCAGISIFDGSEREAAEVSTTVNQAQQYFAADDYQGALETMHAAYGKYPKNAVLRSSYVRIIERIKSNADHALGNRKAAAAGHMYAILEGSSQYREFGELFPFDRELLKKRIRTCSNMLYKSGLLKYREGRLDEAVSIWNKILVFDRENAEARTAINTAVTQMKNLESMRTKR